MFPEGRTKVKDEHRSGRPATARTGENTARESELVRADRRLTVKMIANELNINREIVRLIVTENSCCCWSPIALFIFYLGSVFRKHIVLTIFLCL